jgi:hypothetical protein
LTVVKDSPDDKRLLYRRIGEPLREETLNDRHDINLVGTMRRRQQSIPAQWSGIP